MMMRSKMAGVGRRGGEDKDDGGNGGNASTDQPSKGGGDDEEGARNPGWRGGSCDDEVPLSTIMERLKRTGKERSEAEETMSVESTQGSIQSAGSFFQSSFVKMDMRKEPFEVQSGPVISAADVVRIGDTQYRQK